MTTTGKQFINNAKYSGVDQSGGAQLLETPFDFRSLTETNRLLTEKKFDDRNNFRRVCFNVLVMRKIIFKKVSANSTGNY